MDDGSFYLEMSKTMLMMAYIQGVHTVFATPHSQAFISNQELVLENYQKLLELVESFPFEQKVLLGCEVRCELRNIYARLTKALLCAIHIPVLHIIGHLKGNENVWHAWNTAFIDGCWIWIDNANGIKNFDMPTKVFAKTHILDGGVKVTVDNMVAIDKITELFGYEEC